MSFYLFFNQSLSHLKVFLQLAGTPICLRYRFPLGFFCCCCAVYAQSLRSRRPRETFGKLTRDCQIISLPGNDVPPANVSYI